MLVNMATEIASAHVARVRGDRSGETKVPFLYEEMIRSYSKSRKSANTVFL